MDDQLANVRMLTIVEATEVLGCSRSHLYVLGREKGLPFRRLGGRTVIRVSELAKWLDSQQPLDPSEIGRAS